MTSPPRPVVAMLGISVVGMLIALDQTVVGTALPRMVADLQGFELYPWVATAYLLTTAVMIPVTGRLGDMHGRKPFLVSAIALFVVASAVCGVADSMFQLVLARGLQGIGGGMLLGSTFAAVTDIFPDMLERVRWHALQSSAFGMASALGPVLGGWMTVHLGWRSVFFLNLPIGLLALVIVWRFLPRVVPANNESRDGLDWFGVVLLALSIGTMLIALEFADRLGFSSLTLWGAVLLSLLLGWGFIHHQKHSPAPLIPQSLLTSPVVRRLCFLGGIAGFCLFVLLFYAPLLLQAGFSLSPAEAGLLVAPIMVCLTLGSIINGRLIPRVTQAERLFSKGVVALILGMSILCVTTPSTPHAVLFVVFSLCGFAFGFQLPHLTIQIQVAVARQHVGAASALIQTLRTLGGMFGASLAGLVVNLVFARGASELLRQEAISDWAVSQLFSSPQLLLRAHEQETFSTMGVRLGFDAAVLLDQARGLVVDGIHGAFGLCLILIIISYQVSCKLPPFVNEHRPSVG